MFDAWKWLAEPERRERQRCSSARFRVQTVRLVSALALTGCGLEPAADKAEGAPPARKIQSASSQLSVSGCAIGQGSQANAVWPMAGGCPTRAAQSALTGSLFPTANWRTDLTNDVRSSAAVASDGTIYTSSDDDRLFAIDRSGDILWSFDYGAADRAWWLPRLPLPARSSPAIGADGTIYVGSDHKRLHAVNPATGAEKWAYRTTAAVRSSPVVGPDGTIYFGSQDGVFYAVKADGTLRWKFGLPIGWPLRDIQAGATLDDAGNVYFTVSGHLISLSPTGSLRFYASLNTCSGELVSTPAVANGRVYVGGGSNALYAFNATNGSPVWTRQLGGALGGVLDDAGSPAVGRDGKIYVGSTDSFFYAFSPDGNQSWKYDTGGPINSVPVVDHSEHVFVGSDDNYVYALDGANGQLIWRFNTGRKVRGSVVVGLRGEILSGSDDNHLYSIGEGTPIDLTQREKIRAARKNWFTSFSDDPQPLTDAQNAAAAKAQADTSTAAIGFIDGRVSAGDYLGCARDRADKLEQILVDPQLANAIAAGDQDNDLVPDGRDQCPNTPPLAPTDASGCTIDIEDEYSDEWANEVREDFMNENWIVFPTGAPACDDQVKSQIPRPITEKYANNAIVNVSLDKIFFWFQRTACPARIVIDVTTDDPAGFPNGAGPVLTFDIGPHQQVDPIDTTTQQPVPSATGAVIDATYGAQYQALNAAFLAVVNGTSDYQLYVRAMAVQGNGLYSPFSEDLLIRVLDVRP